MCLCDVLCYQCVCVFCFMFYSVMLSVVCLRVRSVCMCVSLFDTNVCVRFVMYCVSSYVLRCRLFVRVPLFGCACGFYVLIQAVFVCVFVSSCAMLCCD